MKKLQVISVTIHERGHRGYCVVCTSSLCFIILPDATTE